MTLGLIAAGEGSRLRADGFDLPKGLVPLSGIPLIERTIRSFASLGIDRISCIVNEESPALVDFLEQTSFGIPLSLLVRSTPSSLHSLFALAPSLQSDRFFLATVDAVYRRDDLRRFVDACSAHADADGVLAVTDIIDDESPLSIAVDPDTFLVRSIGGDVAASQWVSGGLYHFSPRIFDQMDHALSIGMHRLRAFQSHLVSSGYRLVAHPFGTIIDVDHRTDVVRAEALIAEWESVEGRDALPAPAR